MREGMLVTPERHGKGSVARSISCSHAAIEELEGDFRAYRVERTAFKQVDALSDAAMHELLYRHREGRLDDEISAFVETARLEELEAMLSQAQQSAFTEMRGAMKVLQDDAFQLQPATANEPVEAFGLAAKQRQGVGDALMMLSVIATLLLCYGKNVTGGEEEEEDTEDAEEEDDDESAAEPLTAEEEERNRIIHDLQTAFLMTGASTDGAVLSGRMIGQLRRVGTVIAAATSELQSRLCGNSWVSGNEAVELADARSHYGGQRLLARRDFLIGAANTASTSARATTIVPTTAADTAAARTSSGGVGSSSSGGSDAATSFFGLLCNLAGQLVVELIKHHQSPQVPQQLRRYLLQEDGGSVTSGVGTGGAVTAEAEATELSALSQHGRIARLVGQLVSGGYYKDRVAARLREAVAGCFGSSC